MSKKINWKDLGYVALVAIALIVVAWLCSLAIGSIQKGGPAATNPTETPAPTATQVVSVTTTTVELPAWPETAAEAAKLFGGEASRWETSAEGGWHLREEAQTTPVNANGYLAEGYFDTAPGKDPLCYVYAGTEYVQGTTVWQEEATLTSAAKLQNEMAIPKWKDGKEHPCENRVK